MKTTIRISEGQFGVQVSGIEVILTPGKIFENIERLKPIIKNLIPESIQGEAYPDIDRVYKAIDVIVPLVERFINCWDYDDAFVQEIIINDDGTIDMNWDECKLNFKLKDYFQLIIEFMEVKSKINEILYSSDPSTDQDKEEAMPYKSWHKKQKEEHEKKHEKFVAPLKNRFVDQGLVFNTRPTFQTISDMLDINVASLLNQYGKHKKTYPHQALKAIEVVEICNDNGYNAIIKFTDDLI